MVEGLTLGIVVAAALADSINPCVFGVLIFLLAYMVKVFKNKTRMLIAALIYITAVYITYFLLGVGIFTLAYTAGLAKPFYWFAAAIAIAAGIFEVKDFFWYGRWFSLQIIPGGQERIRRYIKTMQRMETKHPSLSLVIAALLGVLVVFVELPCTGAPYLAILGILSAGEYATGIPLLLLYNLAFILPLFVIVGLVYFGRTSRKLERWRKEHRGFMRLGIGLLLLALGAYMIWAVI
ncbi:MAG: cytochrome c biogenesis CcdA family protein [Candidatus Aenigmatarchaeota archaeon]